jgi:D-beta-D-heptose 7-phosphate kinase/D-beta-D-heptose 1-phosphate adenosyltransferase
MKPLIPSFRDSSVLVIGDVMLDRYWYGATGRVSQEAPVPIVDVDVDATEDRPGGAANVAMNLAALGIDVTLIGVVGADDAAATLRSQLARANVRTEFVEVDEWPTIVKVRVVSRRQQMLRIDFERPLVADIAARLEQLLTAHADRADVVVLEDYDKGTLAQPRRLIEITHAHGKRVVVDPKFKSFDAYRGADVVKPNAAEFARAAGQWTKDDDFVAKAKALAQRCEFGALVVTRGERGLAVVERGGAHRVIEARRVDVFDETGAGDTVAAGLAAGLAAGCDIYDSAALANLAAGIVVAKFGTASATVAELRRALTAGGVVSRDELERIVADARRAGERIVFTNGCFDILHAGHVAYLAEARALGDRLIVAVNDDASVARLKGSGRPVNTLAQRERVLAGLASVDWIVTFGEDTPEALLRAVRPDVLVKGGDYTVDQVVGAHIVRSYGGDVKVLGRVAGASTSAIIDGLRRGRE